MIASIFTTTSVFETVDGYTDVASQDISEATDSYESVTDMLDDLAGYGCNTFYAVESSADPMPMEPGAGVWLSTEPYAHPYRDEEESKTLHLPDVTPQVRGYVFRVLLCSETRVADKAWATENAYALMIEEDAAEDGIYAGWLEEDINCAAEERVLEFLTACESEGVSAWPAADAGMAHAAAKVGRDLYYTQHGAGTGFWAGDYAERGDELTRIAKECGQFC